MTAILMGSTSTLADTPELQRRAFDDAFAQRGDGVGAAVAADVPCVAFPDVNTAGHDVSAADERVDALDLADLRAPAGDPA